MKNDRKREIIDSMKQEMDQDEFKFDDLMSRHDKNKIKQQKKFEEKIMKELEQKKKKKAKKKLEQTQKLEKEKIKQAMKQEKKKQKSNLEEVTHIVTDNHTLITSSSKKKSINKFTKFFLSFTAIGILVFWIFNILDSFNRINHIYTLVCSSLISLGCLLLVLAGLMTKNKPRSIANVIGASCLLSFAIINTLVLSGTLTFPTQPVLLDFSNKNVNVAVKWANENAITLEPTYEYSDVIKENNIITQDKKGDVLAKNVKHLEIIVSKGPNYELEANLPDMMGWDVDRVVKKLKALKLDLEKIDVDFVFHDEKRDTLFEQNKTGKIRRNDNLKLKFSLGKEEDLKPVKLIDLKNKDKFDATIWLKRNGIQYEIEYKFDDHIDKGKVIATDPKPGTTIKQSETTVKVYISKGAKIIAPDFMTMSMDEIIEWASKNNVNLNYESEYSDSVKTGDIIRVSAKKGTVIEEGSTISIVTSKGSLKMINFNNDLSKLRAFAEEHKLSLVEKQEFNSEVAQGKIVSVSHKPGQIIHPGETIEIVISKGNSIKVPNFIGMTESAAKNECNRLELACTISYVYASKTKGTVIDQNKSVGSELAKNASVVLSVSAGEAPSYSGSGGSSNSNNNSNSSGGNSGGNNQRPTPTPTPNCKTTTFYIYPEHIAINNPSNTCSNIKNAYPGFNIACSYIASNNGKKGQVLNRDQLNGITINSCNTITIQIKNN